MSRNIFEKRTQFKPFEYPEVLKFIDMIHQTFWVHTEIDFAADLNDYKVNIDEREKTIFKRSLLGIAQIEVDVKQFWGDIYKIFPKPEINGMGSTFASNEWIHSQAYSNLLTICDLETEFDNLNDYEVLVRKMNFNRENLTSSDPVQKLLFFVIGIENASLFSQFANILSLSRFKGLMKNVGNIINWTSADEATHAIAGEFLLRTVFEENPHYKEKYNQEYVAELVNNFIKTESDLVEWIYEFGDTGFFTKTDVINYMKFRIDNSLKNIGYEKVFNITSEELKPMMWFEEEVFSNALDDFFAKRPTEYTKHSQAITADSIF